MSSAAKIAVSSRLSVRPATALALSVIRPTFQLENSRFFGGRARIRLADRRAKNSTRSFCEIAVGFRSIRASLDRNHVGKQESASHDAASRDGREQNQGAYRSLGGRGPPA